MTILSFDNIFCCIFRCDFIQMGYFIHVVARTPSVLDDIVVKLPIVINPKVRLKILLILLMKFLINLRKGINIDTGRQHHN